MRILIVDDHALFREGLSLLIIQLEPQTDITLVSNVDEAVHQILNNFFDLILLDWNLDGETGEAALKAVQELNHSSRVVILSAERDLNLIKKCIDSGASGFIHKDSTPTSLIAAIKSILDGKIYLPADAFTKSASNCNSNYTRSIKEVFPELTPRQICVLTAMVRGLPNKLIAREMNISEDTVKQHLTAIYRVMDVNNRTQAVYNLAQNKITVEAT